MLLRTIAPLLILTAGLSAQSPLAPEQVIEKVTPSVATVLVGNGTGTLSGVGSAVVVRDDGVLFTAWHVVKDAREVQIKFSNGEVFDEVKLLGVDERRDVAALRISAGRLPTLATASLSELKPGAAIYTVSQARALPWTASSGVISAVRLADGVPGAGSGYRLVQFTAPISEGSSGGLLVDGSARVVGIIVATMPAGQNMNFAVPLESVLGLANAEPRTTYRAGTKLQLPTATPPTPHLKEGVDIDGPEKSDVISSRDPNVIMKKFRTIAVKSDSVWVKDEVVKNALRNRPEFSKMGLTIVDDPRVADAVVITDRVLFTWDFTYRLVHQNTSIVLAMGKFTRIDGLTAATSFAEDIVKKVKVVRMPRGEDNAEAKKESKPKQAENKRQGDAPAQD